MKASPETDPAGAAGFPTGFTVREALLEGSRYLECRGIDGVRLDAEVLLAAALGVNRAGLYSMWDRALSPRDRELFGETLRRRSRREPVAYIVGVREFWSLDFAVNSQVLIPRPETEVLVEVAQELLRDGTGSRAHGTRRILELGTGSGAVAVSLAKERGDVEVWAGDISIGALEVARRNALSHGVRERVHLICADLFGGLKKHAAFDLIVSNPPYVKRGVLAHLAPEVKDWEPVAALDGGADGLDFYRRMIAEGSLYLRPGGAVVVEIGSDMAPELSKIFAAAGGYSPCVVHRDYGGRDRVVVARASSRSPRS